MKKKNYISVRRAKQILLTETKKLLMEENIDINYKLINIIEYYFSDYFKQDKRKSLKNALLYPTKVDGWYQSFQIVYFNKSFFFLTEEKFIDLLKGSLHEINHAIESKEINNVDNKTKFLYLYESNLINIDYNYYLKNWHNFLKEKTANLYGIIKAKEILKNNYPDIYNRNKEYINGEIEKHEFQYINYDFNNLYTKHYNDFIHDSSGNFKDVYFIYKYYEDYDKKIAYMILTTDLFLMQLDINALSDIEIDIMLSALNFKYTGMVTRLEYLKCLSKDSNNYLNLLKEIEDIKEVIYSLKNKKNLTKLAKCKIKEGS